MSSILAMYSSLSSGTDHIFFPPRFELVAEEKNPDRFPPRLGGQFAFHRFLGDQPDGPPRAALRDAAGHIRRAPARIPHSAFRFPEPLSMSDGHWRPPRKCSCPHGAGTEPDSLKQHHRLDAAVQDSIQLVTVALFQLHTETPIGPHALLCSETFQYGIVLNNFFKRSKN